MREALIIISILSVALFFVITIIRIIATIILKYTISKYLKLLALLRPKDKMDDNKYIPSSRNDILYRDKDIEKQKEQEAQKLVNVQRLPKVGGEEFDLEPNYSKKNIVGMVKPIGYWTSLIMGQRVTSLMQHAEVLKQQNDNGYWVNMMHARDMAKGKSRGM